MVFIFLISRVRLSSAATSSGLVVVVNFVVVVNCEKVKVTGNKAKGKIYHTHSAYPGGLKSISFEKLIERAPERVIQNAVKGMLPKNALGRAMFKKLKVYAGGEHPHGAQQPQAVQF